MSVQPTNKCSFGPGFYLHFHSCWIILGRRWSLWLHYEPSCALSCAGNAVFSFCSVTNSTYFSWHSKNGKIGKYSSASLWILLLLRGSNPQNMRDIKFLLLNQLPLFKRFPSAPALDHQHKNRIIVLLLLKITQMIAAGMGLVPRAVF